VLKPLQAAALHHEAQCDTRLIMVTLSRHVTTPKSYSLELPGRGTLQDKLYVGFVKVADDILRMGRLKVWIPELNGDPNDEGGWFLVNYCAPFAGATNVYDNKNENTYLGTQKSYGMWFVPPDINNEVVCAFINGDPGRGIWFGCLFQQNMNHMIPGIPGQDSTASLPVAEYNKKFPQTNIEQPSRPLYEPLAQGLIIQGLDKDTIRGVSDSGARRNEPPNSVYGILTPGGSQFVFDDSPSNNYIRLRTQSGAQIMINDTSGFIYLNSVDGKNWISMDATGKIDIYAQDDISIRSKASVNIRGDIDVNIEAGRDINMRARGRRGISTVAGNQADTPAINPLSDQAPPTVPNGNIVVVGDSIAVGTGSRIKDAIVAAKVGDSSTAIANKVADNPSIKGFVNAIISAGSNDPTNPQLTNNLSKIRSSLQARNYIWLLPYNSQAKATVSNFAQSNGDKTIDLSTFPTGDNLHPKNYGLVANQATSICIPPPPATPTPATTGSNQNVTPQYYTELSKAEARATSARAAADHARNNPNEYTEAQTNNIIAEEQSANAALAQLKGQGATTSTTAQLAATPPPPAQTAPGAEAPPAKKVPTWQEVAGPFIKKEEGGKKPHLTAYKDPPNQSADYSIGYGHLMKFDILEKKTSLNCSPAPPMPIVGPGGRDSVMTAEQAEALFQIDLEQRAANPARRILKGAWDLLGPYQKAAIASYVYNCGGGGLNPLVANGITDLMSKNDIEGAARILETNGYQGWKGNPTGLAGRRKREANLYRESPDLAGQSPTGTEVDGYPRTPADQGAAGSGTLSQVDLGLQGGFIRIESTNSMHILTSQHMFVSSSRDMHHLAGGNSFDSTVGNVNRAAGGYVHEGIKGDYQMGVGSKIVMSAPRVDINGPAPIGAIAAAQAVGPISLKQTDADINSFGNIVSVNTETILPHLPFHEPYDNHGGRSFANIRDATTFDENTGLRDGEVIINSNDPLDIYGTPRNDMPPAVYRGNGYNSRNQPLYRYESPLGNAAILTAATLQINSTGEQFIKARENGSYRTIVVGEPPRQEIGYGHTLTPEEITTKSIVIKGQSFSLEQNLSQQNINDLFDDDIRKTQDWMRPLIKVGLSQTQYNMFCSLAFNIGENNFKNSQTLKEFNDGNLQKVPNTWMQWTKNAANKIVPQLQVRRRAEVVQFMQGPAIDDTGGESNAAIDFTQATFN
jgi:GH24 family phage-related lysozyme (muramidase)